MSKQKKSITSIKTKILTAVSALVLILVLILILLSYMISKNIIEDKSKQVLELSVKNQASQMEAWMTESLNVFNTFKENLETMDYTDEQIQTLLDSYLGKSSNYPDGFYIADSDGKVMQADGVEYKKTISDDPVWYTEGLTRVNMAFGDVFTNEAGDEVISASAILRNPDKIRVIAIDVPIAHIQVIVNSFISMDDAQAVLIDRSTMNILSQSEDSLSGSLSDDSGFLGTIGEKIDEQDYDSISLDNNIVEFREISGTNWVLVSYVPEASIFAELVSLRTTMAIVAVVILIILLVLMERMVNYMIKPIKSLTDSIVMMASGDFTVDIKTKGNDEITVMGQSMKDFAASMRKMINDIVNASETLQGQAESSSTVSGGLYEASLTQSKTIDNLNETVDQLSASVQEIAENATSLAMVVSETKDSSMEAEQKMNETVTVAESGKSDMEKVGEAMNVIQSSINSLQESIDEVGTASSEINNIVSMIGEIADETNLLALNASIEAARAGDAGRGFAVVASEIGGLADDSNKSVQKIQGLIDQVTSLVAETVEKAKQSVDEISSSSELVNQAVNTFDTIYDNIINANHVVNNMASSMSQVESVATNVAAITEEQAASAEVISGNAGNIVAESQNITNDSEKVADTAKELADTSENLMTQIKSFRV
ncbi:MAG: methyl-accepting chemotaxis protein [Agathobacter sp.]|uniref:methyl-accepting chemotaxis protein n=1 Tax=Agathobacter sp. TaxID=2021311 RepID=UPI003993EC9A